VGGQKLGGVRHPVSVLLPTLCSAPFGDATRGVLRDAARKPARFARIGAKMEKAPPGPAPYGDAAATLPIFFENGEEESADAAAPFTLRVLRGDATRGVLLPPGVLRDATPLGNGRDLPEMRDNREESPTRPCPLPPAGTFGGDAAVTLPIFFENGEGEFIADAEPIR
jgi:hypothetical protein